MNQLFWVKLPVLISFSFLYGKYVQIYKFLHAGMFQSEALENFIKNASILY